MTIMVVRGQIRRNIAQRQLKGFQKKKTKVTRFTTSVGKDAFIGRHASIGRTNRKVIKRQFTVNRLQAKITRIEANLLRAEASWPVIKQVRRWFWNWREKRVSKRLGKKQEKLSLTQARQTKLRDAYGTRYDTRLGRKQKKVDVRKTGLDVSLNKMGTQLRRFKKIVDLEVNRLELINGTLTVANQIPATQFADLRTKLETEMGNADRRTAAFRVLEIDSGIEQIRQLVLRNQFAPAQTQMAELIAFNENAP
ncbi:hypothetical protein KKE06_02545 [Candidatus Micrarchaeota archaeon]|nr:hypothetical protein [Candidatus Micrarchaeota archaeon]MBU1930990.1 hypothetical protein [Candidatus Micrarchaeota archaeon]